MDREGGVGKLVPGAAVGILDGDVPVTEVAQGVGEDGDPVAEPVAYDHVLGGGAHAAHTPEVIDEGSPQLWEALCGPVAEAVVRRRLQGEVGGPPPAPSWEQREVRAAGHPHGMPLATSLTGRYRLHGGVMGEPAQSSFRRTDRPPAGLCDLTVALILDQHEDAR